MLLNNDQIKVLMNLYESGKSYPKIASMFRKEGIKICNETVREYLFKMGVKMRKSRESLAAPLNERFFDNINNEVQAYWLGFLLADACIGKSAGDRRSLRFYLAAKDEQAVRQFAKDIEYGGKIRTPGVSRGQYGICFNNKYLCEKLSDIGFLDWKSNGSSKILGCVPPEMRHHFVRGFFDGDGCISGRIKRLKSGRTHMSYYFNFAANKRHGEAMNALEHLICDAVGLPQKGVKIRKTSLSLGWNGNKQVEKFGRWLYRDATRYLQRKFDRFQQLTRQAGNFLDFQDIVINPVSIEEYREFFDKHHYLGCGGRRGFALGAYYNGQLIAAALIGSITRAEMAFKQGLKPNEVRELARFCVHPDFHVQNLPTWFLSRMVKRFVYEFPAIKLLISFADTTQGHEGTIYKASNWLFDGFTGRSHHYLDKDGNILHKKTIYDLSRKVKKTEKQYATDMGLAKVFHKRKKRFLLHLGR